MLVNAADPASDEQGDAVDSMLHYLGTTGDFDPARSYVDEVNAALAGAVDPAVGRHTTRRS